MLGSPDVRGFARRTIDALTIASLVATSACAGPVSGVGEQESEQGGQNFSEQQYQTAYEVAIEKQLAGLVFEINGIRAGNANVTEVSESLPISGSLTAQSTRISKIQLSEENGVTHEVWGVTPKTWNGMDGETFFLSLADVGVAEDGSLLTEGWLLKRVEGTDLIKPVLTASGEVVVAAEIWSRDGQVQSADIFFDAAGSNQDKGSLVEAFLDLGANPAYGQAAETSTPEPTKVVSTVTPEITVTRTPTPTATETQEPTPKPDMNEVYKASCKNFSWRNKTVNGPDGLGLPTGMRGVGAFNHGGHDVIEVVACPKSVQVNDITNPGITMDLSFFNPDGTETIIKTHMGNVSHGGVFSFGVPVPDGVNFSYISPDNAINLFGSLGSLQLAFLIRLDTEGLDREKFLDALKGLTNFPSDNLVLTSSRAERFNP